MLARYRGDLMDQRVYLIGWTAAVASASVVEAGARMIGGDYAIRSCVVTIGTWCPVESLGPSIVGTIVSAVVLGGAALLFHRLRGKP